MAKKRRDPIGATGRYMAYGSTRYTSKGSKKSHATLKAMGTTSAIALASSAVLPGVGAVPGLHLGRRVSVHRGYIRRDKQRFTLRKLDSQYGGADPAFKTSVKHHHGKRTHR